MSGNTPRKFSEKIAIMERKQNEDVNQFEDIMREVRSITSTTNEIPIAGALHPPAWPHNHFGGSLPNVAQLPSYQPAWPQWDMHLQRSRSPDSMQHPAHFHPYGRGPHRSPDRVPPLHPHYAPYPQQHTLQPPDQWNQINRARSDPAIHNGVQMAQHHQMMGMHSHHQPYMQMQAGPSGMHSENIATPMTPMSMQQQSAFNMQPVMNTSPINSPNMLHGYQYPNGSPMQSPHGSPMGSQMMLDERNTPLMELSPPGMHDPSQEAGSLPNLQQMPPVTNYHATVGQRHSTGGQCGRLVPGPTLTPESQSAPTSPGNVIDPSQQTQWPAARTFSNSPELYDIPRVVLTNPDGADGHHLECYNDGQLHNMQTPDGNASTNGTLPNQQQGLYQ